MGQTAKPPLGWWGPWGLRSDHMPSAAVTQSLTEGRPSAAGPPGSRLFPQSGHRSDDLGSGQATGPGRWGLEAAVS